MSAHTARKRASAYFPRFRLLCLFPRELRPKDGEAVGGVCRQPQDLADLVQEVFMRAFSREGRQAYDGLRDYGPYLFAIARNVLVDWARVRGREIPSPWLELETAIEMVPVATCPPERHRGFDNRGFDKF